MASTPVVNWRVCPPGNWGSITRALLVSGWEDSRLSQAALPVDDWLALQDSVIADFPHAQVTIEVDCEVVGAIVLLDTVDAQVGKALVAFHQFLLPEHRGDLAVWRKALRTAEAVARKSLMPWLIWTHRKPNGRIYYTYKEIK